MAHDTITRDELHSALQRGDDLVLVEARGPMYLEAAHISSAGIATRAPIHRAPDVAVIGAGIVGAACALFLARSGARVELFERAFPAAGSTGAGEGNVLAWDKELHRELPLALRSA